MTTTEATETTTRQRDALGERLFGSLLGGMELLTVQLGVQTGLYAALRDGGPATAGELAGQAGVAERYAREWLEQQATAGFVEVIAPGGPEQRRYRLPDGHAEALLEEESSGYMAAAAPFLVGLTKALAEVAAAYHSGDGVAYARYGADIRHGIGSFNRPMFSNELATEWLPALGDVHARLGSGAPARVLDVACGTGWSSIALARAYPGVQVDGVDLDEDSVADARRNAADAGVADRVRFEVGNAAALDGAGGYDLACIFEALHDMGDPVGALRQIRGLLSPGAPLLVVDERVAEAFTAAGDEIERLNYAFMRVSGPGVCSDVDRATQQHGLATVLVWAIRGAGANLGVVTRFTFRLHEVGPSVTGGLILWGATGGNYVNFQLAEDDTARTAAAYRNNHERLRRVKAAYDPDNLFRVNRNIPPTA